MNKTGKTFAIKNEKTGEFVTALCALMVSMRFGAEENAVIFEDKRGPHALEIGLSPYDLFTARRVHDIRHGGDQADIVAVYDAEGGAK